MYGVPYLQLPHQHVQSTGTNYRAVSRACGGGTVEHVLSVSAFFPTITLPQNMYI